MELKDQRRIAAPREAVFAALNDPDILAKSIPGCESLEKVSDTEFNAVVQAKVGPVRAKFNGNVTLSDLNPPESYTISGEGKGGAAGFAKGSAVIMLADDGGETVMTYEVKADVGGKLAQLGGRLIEGTSKKLAGEFFDAFEAQVTGGEQMEQPIEVEQPVEQVPAAAGAEGMGFWRRVENIGGGVWIPIYVALFLAVAYFLSNIKLQGS